MVVALRKEADRTPASLAATTASAATAATAATAAAATKRQKAKDRRVRPWRQRARHASDPCGHCPPSCQFARKLFVGG